MKNTKIIAVTLLTLAFMLFSTYEYYERVYVQGQPELQQIKEASEYINQNSDSEDLVFGGGAGFPAEIALRTGNNLALGNPIFDSSSYRANYQNITKLFDDLENLQQERKLKFVIWTETLSFRTIEEWREFDIFLEEFCSQTAFENDFVIVNECF